MRTAAEKNKKEAVAAAKKAKKEAGAAVAAKNKGEEDVATQLKAQVPSWHRLHGTLVAASEELPDIPLYYMLPSMCATLHCSCPPMDHVYAAIMNSSYEVPVGDSGADSSNQGKKKRGRRGKKGGGGGATAVGVLAEVVGEPSQESGTSAGANVEAAVADATPATRRVHYRVSASHRTAVAIKTDSPPERHWDILRAWVGT
jgi:tRNA G26 N,N-dimethylase Trm1